MVTITIIAWKFIISYIIFLLICFITGYLIEDIINRMNSSKQDRIIFTTCIMNIGFFIFQFICNVISGLGKQNYKRINKMSDDIKIKKPSDDLELIGLKDTVYDFLSFFLFEVMTLEEFKEFYENIGKKVSRLPESLKTVRIFLKLSEDKKWKYEYIVSEQGYYRNVYIYCPDLNENINSQILEKLKNIEEQILKTMARAIVIK